MRRKNSVLQYAETQIIQVNDYDLYLGPYGSMQHVQLPEVLSISTTTK